MPANAVDVRESRSSGIGARWREGNHNLMMIHIIGMTGNDLGMVRFSSSKASTVDTERSTSSTMPADKSSKRKAKRDPDEDEEENDDDAEFEIKVRTNEPPSA